MAEKFTPHVLEKLTSITWPGFSPDDTFFWVETKNGSSFIKKSSPAGAEPVSGSLPRCCGSEITFLADRGTGKQLFRAEKQLTTLRHGVNWYSLSGDGKKAVFTANLWDEELAEGTWNREFSEDELAAWKKEQSMRPEEITEIVYKHDSTHGIFDGSKSRLGIWAEGNCELLPVDLFCTFPVFSPDGSQIAFFGYPHKGVQAMNPELFVYDLPSGKTIPLTRGQEIYADCPVCWNKESIIYAAWVTYTEEAFDLRLFCTDTNGAEPVALMADEAIPPVGGMPVSRFGLDDTTPCYQAAEGRVFYRSAWKGRERLYSIRADGSKDLQTILSGDFAVHSFALSGKNKLLAVLSDPLSSEELFLVDPESGQRSRITGVNDFLCEYELQAPLESTIPTKDGTANLPMWVIPPAEMEKGKKYPAVLEIHGGPECCYVLDLWHEFQALGGAQIAVIYCNPRGSSGYGSSFMYGAWEQEAVNDLLSCVSEACRKYRFIDENRIGVTGGSYGGYMTIKLAGTTKRFRAACAQRALCNTATSYGTGDLGFESFGRKPEEIDMLNVLTNRARKSLIRFVDNIDTPMLILHGKEDFRCTFEQAEQLFIAMRERRPDVPCRLVLFPHENHGITRTGSIAHQMRHLSELVNWFKKYL